MARQSITFTKSNDKWLKEQVANEEYASKSELVNNLVRQARNAEARINWIRHKIEKAENSGFTDKTKSEILANLTSHNRQPRIDSIRHKIKRAEESGFTGSNKADILVKVKSDSNE